MNLPTPRSTYLYLASTGVTGMKYPTHSFVHGHSREETWVLMLMGMYFTVWTMSLESLLKYFWNNRIVSSIQQRKGSVFFYSLALFSQTNDHAKNSFLCTSKIAPGLQRLLGNPHVKAMNACWVNGCGDVLFRVLMTVPTLEKEVVLSRPQHEVVVCIQIASYTGV